MPAIDHGPEELPGGGREDDGVGARRPGGRSQRGRPAPLAANRQARPTVASALIGGAILRAVLASATAHLTYGSYGIWGDRAAWVVTLVTWVVVGAAWGGNFSEDVEIVWGESRAKIFNHGKLLELSMDKDSGSAFKSRNEYLFGRIDMQLKLVAGNSAGTVTTYYVTSVGDAHDEIDFEFLGNVTGEPYILHTNVFSQGKGNREVQFYLWFDPTKNFHTYSILWNPQHIIFFVDGIPIRDFKNSEHKGVPFPKSQPMRIRGSLWDAEGWATRGGLEKTDWSEAPFRAFYRNLQTDGCVGWTYPYCMSRAWFKQELDAHQRRQMRWVKKRFMIYNYCADGGRFAGGLPPECS